MFKKLLMVAVVCLLAMPMTATAQKRKLQLQNKGQHHDPIRVAPIKGWKNGKPIIGEWVAYKPAGVAAGPSPFPVGVLIDSYEGDSNYGNANGCDMNPAQNFPANGPLSGGVSPVCGGSTGGCGDGDTNRWWFGLGPAWSGSIGAVGNFADNAPTVSTAMSFSWSQSFGSDNSSPCNPYIGTFVIINFYDNTVASKIDVDNAQDLDTTILAEGFVDGVVLGFGPLTTSTAGYAFSSPDLTDGDPELYLGVVDGIEVGLPSDGALEVLYWDDDGLGNPVPGSYAQPMLWAPKDSALQGSWNSDLYYLDGFVDFDAGNALTCSAYDGQYLVNTDDDAFVVADPDGCLQSLMPSIGLFGEPSTGPVTVTADLLTVTAGIHISGGLPELAESDEQDLKLQRNSVDTSASTEFEVIGTSPTETPASFVFTLEGAVFARTNVVQTIELFDYDAAAWELVDSSDAARSPAPDSVVTAAATGDLSRFVEAGTLSIKARIRFVSDNGRQRFATNTDQTIWTIGQ